MISHLTFSDKIDALYSEFMSGEARAGSDGPYREEVEVISAACRIKYNRGTHYIQLGGMVPGKPEDQNYYRGELGGQLGFMCAIKIMESILGGPLVINSCDKISILRQASIYPEAVKSIWKQLDLISRIFDVYNSMESGMSLVHIHEHQNNGRLDSNLTPLAPLNVRMDPLVEQIMA